MVGYGALAVNEAEEPTTEPPTLTLTSAKWSQRDNWVRATLKQQSLWGDPGQDWCVLTDQGQTQHQSFERQSLINMQGQEMLSYLTEWLVLQK